MQGATGGAVIPFERAGTPAVKEEYTEAIKLWCQTRDTAEILSKEEIGAMQQLKRLDVQRKGIILALAHYYRQHERADVAPGIAVMITLMTDNEKGYSSISQPTLAKLFGRSLSSIGDAVRRLKDDGLIISGRGRFPATVPVIPRAVASEYNHLTWLVSAICETEAKPVNLPVPSEDCQSTGPARGLNQSTYGTGGLEKLNPPDKPVSIPRGDRCLLQDNNSTTLNRTAVVLAGIATAFGVIPAAATPADPPSIVQPVLSMAEMHSRMMDAGGDALSDPISAPKLNTYVELQSWLGSGCDFETDILQTIRAVSAKRARRSISTWSYFRQAIADAKATRLAPMPEGRAPPSQLRSYADQEAERVGKFMAAVRSSKNGSSSREVSSAAPADLQPAEDG